MKIALIGKASWWDAFFICALAFSLPAAAETARVARVIDGDSLRLNDGREIRLIGINAPELGKNGAPDEPLARAALAELVRQGEIHLEYDAERHDRYGRTLAHVSLPDGRRAEEILLRQGWVFLIAQPPNLSKLEIYNVAERQARREQLGVWSRYKTRAATQMKSSDTGFHFVDGTVKNIGRGPHAIYLDLSDRFSIVIPHEDWHFFGGDPKRFLGRHIGARGWVTAHANRMHLRVSHPFVMDVTD